MPAGFPNGSTHENGTIHADDIVPELGHTFPPVILQVTFQGDAEGAVVPRAVEATVDLGGWKDESPAFTEGNDFFHAVIGHRSNFWILGDEIVAMMGKDEHPNFA